MVNQLTVLLCTYYAHAHAHARAQAYAQERTHAHALAHTRTPVMQPLAVAMEVCTRARSKLA